MKRHKLLKTTDKDQTNFKWAPTRARNTSKPVENDDAGKWNGAGRTLTE